MQQASSNTVQIGYWSREASLVNRPWCLDTLMNASLTISSKLGTEHLDELEELLFFNPQQRDVTSGIVRAIDLYGSPKIYSQGPLLRIRVGDLPGVQALYAIEQTIEAGRLVGVIIYARRDTSTMVLLHVSVAEDYSASGIHANARLTMKLVLRLRAVARSLKGVTVVEVPYNPRGSSRVQIQG
jgi:hypothetical protein